MKKLLMAMMVVVIAFSVQAALIVDPGTINFWNRIDAGTGSNIGFTMPTMTTVGTARIYDNDFITPIIATGSTVGTGNKSTFVGPNIFGAFRHTDTVNATAPAVIGTARSQVTGAQLTPAATSGAATFDFMYVIKKADFANGLNSGSVGFAATDGFKFSTGTYNANTKSMRAVVLNGSTWYVSQAAYTGNSGVDRVILSDAANALWAVWNPLTSIDASTLNFTTTVAGSTLKDIQAAGIYGHFEKTITALSMNITKLEIGASAIPEPATIGMLGLGALITILIRRMRG
jgi:hypothetical protein